MGNISPYIILAGIAVFLLAFFKVEIVMLTLIALIPFENVTTRIFNLGSGVNLINIFMLLIFFGWATRAVVRREKLFVKNSLNIPILLFIVITYLAQIRGTFYLGYSAFGETLLSYKRFISSVFLYFLVVNSIKNLRSIKISVVTMILVSLYIARLTFLEHFLIAGTHYIEEAKYITGPFINGNSNDLGAFFAQYVPIMAALMLINRSFIKRMALTAGSLYCISALLYTYSRGSYFAIVCALLFMGLVKKNKLLILAVILAVVFYAFLLPPSVVERIQMSSLEEGSFQGRLNLWRFGVSEFLNNPFLGIGFSTFDKVGTRGAAHNIFILIAMECGLFGIGILLWILFIAFKEGWWLFKNTNNNFVKGLSLATLASLIAVVTGNFFGNRLLYYPQTSYFWVLLGLMMSAKELSRKESVESR